MTRENKSHYFSSSPEVSEVGLATQDYMRLQQNADIASALALLHQEGLLTKENRILVSRDIKYANDIASGLVRLWKSNLFTEENKTLLVQSAEYAFYIASALYLLRPLGLDTQDNYMVLIRYREFRQKILDSLPSSESSRIGLTPEQIGFNQEKFNEIIQEIDKENLGTKIAFSMGGHARLGSDSAIRIFFADPLCDKANLSKEIFAFFPQPDKKIECTHEPFEPEFKFEPTIASFNAQPVSRISSRYTLFFSSMGYVVSLIGLIGNITTNATSTTLFATVCSAIPIWGWVLLLIISSAAYAYSSKNQTSYPLSLTY